MKKLNLYEHQEKAVLDTRIALREHKAVLIVAPTGMGKTILSTYFVSSLLQKKKRVYFLVHRKELLDQTVKTFVSFGLNCGIIAAGHRMRPRALLQCCSIDTLKNRMTQLKYPDVVIVDEAHHAAAASYLNVLNYYDKSIKIGLTATPQRLDGMGLDVAFDHMIKTVETSWLIKQGYLATYKLYSFPGVGELKSKFTNQEAESAVDKPSIMGDVVKHWFDKAHMRKTIMFAPSIKKSKEFAQAFKDAGINAIHVDGETPKPDRTNIMRRFAEGGKHGFDVLINVGLLGEGFDIEANSGLPVTVSCMIDAAPTQSLSAWRQRCGRALRRQKTVAVILDHAGNYWRHGAPCDQIEWSLSGGVKNDKPKESEQSLRQCENCYVFHLPAKVCPECGYEPETQSRKITEIEGDLEEVDTSKNEDDEPEESLHDLYREAVLLGFPPAFDLKDVDAMNDEQKKLHHANLKAALVMLCR